ncbi:ATP-binding protein [Cryptosporangium sp. NPDC048952]|uniref:ATP-binding protein n=1 Tax=Cryptosporangium sp. NPDC048952 TaxID=3363961 RepID=UPI00371AB9CE
MNPQPSSNAPVLEDVYPPVAVSVAQARHDVRRLLAHWEVTDTAVEDVALVVEELLANVIDHARTPFRLTVDRRDSTIGVAVRDESSALPEMRDLDLTALRGRGLRLVAAIAQRWGYEREDTGKIVWAEIAV